MVRIAVTLALCVMAAGCAPRQGSGLSSYDMYLAQQREKDRVAAEEVSSMAAEMKAGTVPADYKFKADGWFSQVLKDPDSRKVVWAANSGSVVCGTVNSKNSYGGYVGATPFAAHFDDGGSLKLLYIYSNYRDIPYSSTEVRAMASICSIR